MSSTPRRLGISCITIFALLTGADVFDPKPRGPVKHKLSRSSNDTTQQRAVRQRLTAYGIGRYVHPGIPRLCSQVVRDIETWESNGWLVDRVVIRGYADGIPNRRVYAENMDLPPSCSSQAHVKRPDEQLARLRACHVLHALLKTPHLHRPVAITWVTDDYDEPDGGRTGPAYRKVEVELAMRR